MHFGRRGEGSGRQGEEFLDAGVELRGGGKKSVVAGAGLGGDAISYFALYQNDDGLKIFGVVEQAQQNFGGDVVRKIADDLHRLGRNSIPGRRRPGFGPNKESKSIGENVSLDDLDVGEHAEAEAKLRGQHAVEFYGDEAADAPGQQGSENASSGADFEHGILRVSPRASTICMAKLSLARKCCPNLGLC